MGINDASAKRLRSWLDNTLSYRETRETLDRTKSFYRASRLYDSCAREETLCARHGVMNTRSIPAALRLVFAQGTALHSVVQNDLFAEIGALYGRWKCRSCRHVVGGAISKEESKRYKAYRTARPITPDEVEDFLSLRAKLLAFPSPLPKQCPSCGREHKPRERMLFEYKEYWLGALEYRIGGSMDGFLQVPWREDLGVLEAKSISKGQLFTIQHQPKPAHIMQATVYMMLTGLKWALILYWVKGENGLDALIPYEIDYSPIEVANVKAKLSSIWSAIDDPMGPLPPRVCDNAHCRRAQSCPVQKECFSEETQTDF